MSIWLITGCSSGLGKGIAQAVLKRGEKAAVIARNIQALQEFEEQYPSQVLALEMDLNEAESMKQAVAKTREPSGQTFTGKDSWEQSIRSRIMMSWEKSIGKNCW